ncbi:alpha/beta hydrolase family protein [Mycobacterium xenopi 3993]|nr:alpha/beta hydrolase family protein [Mycobacterium xenopi 3993]
MTATNVTASDGVTLAVHPYGEIDQRRPTILAVHGYPDNHHVWDGVAAELADRYNVVTYDVRGPVTLQNRRIARDTGSRNWFRTSAR